MGAPWCRQPQNLRPSAFICGFGPFLFREETYRWTQRGEPQCSKRASRSFIFGVFAAENAKNAKKGTNAAFFFAFSAFFAAPPFVSPNQHHQSVDPNRRLKSWLKSRIPSSSGTDKSEGRT